MRGRLVLARQVWQIVRSRGELPVVAAILVAIGLAYAPTIGDWFTSDDFYYLREADTSSTGAYVRAAFRFTGGPGVPFWLYRPLSLLNFLWLYVAFGDHAWGYRLVALGVHIANTVLVWLVASRLTKRAPLAHVSALVFGLHPTYAPAVAWISNSMSLFASTFALSALLLFLKYVQGGVGASRYQVAAFPLTVIAAFVHPEAVHVIAVICLAQLLSHGPDVNGVRAPRTWAPLVPYVAFSIGFLALHFYIREQEPLQKDLFKWGDHLVSNYLGNVAMAGNPFGPDSSTDGVLPAGNRLWATSFMDPRTLLPIIGVGIMSLTLLAAELRRPGARMLAVVWFYLSLVPISTSPAMGVTARKLYVAGPAFALMIAMWVGLVLEWARAAVPRVLSRFGFGFVRERGVQPVWTGVALGAVVAVFFAIRIMHVTSPDFMGYETHNRGVTSQMEKALVDEIEVQQPHLASGSELVVVGVPRVLMEVWGLEPRFLAAVELFHPGVSVGCVSNLGQVHLPEPAPGVARSYVFLDSYVFLKGRWFNILQRGDTVSDLAAPGFLSDESFLLNPGNESLNGWRAWHGTLSKPRGAVRVASHRIAYSAYQSTLESGLHPVRGQTYLALAWVKGTESSAGGMIEIRVHEEDRQQHKSYAVFQLALDWEPIWVAHTVQEPNPSQLTVSVVRLGDAPQDDAFLFRDAQLRRLQE